MTDGENQTTADSGGGIEIVSTQTERADAASSSRRR